MYWFLAFVVLLVVAEEVEFPAPLTSSNFNQKLSSGLHLVEFYSPYCSHCKHFAPTWEATYKSFHDEGLRLGVGMAQVDCVESGDLCNEQKITAYPSLKLYGPNGFIKNYPRSYRRKEEDLVKFMKNEALKTDSNEVLTSRSKLIDTDEILKLFANVLDKPVLLSLWPSHDLEDLSIIQPAKFHTPYDEETINFQRSWNKVSQILNPDEITVGHFNCLSNKKICDALKLDSKQANIVLILPNLASGKIINYDQSIYKMDPSSIVEFTQRVVSNAQFKHIKVTDLVEPMKITTSLFAPDDIPQRSDVHFVYLYDDETVTEEDFELLPYLTETLSNLPGTHIYKSNDTHMLDLYKLQRAGIYKSVDGEISEQQLEFEMLTSLPTMLVFKEFGMLPEIYHSFGPNEIRDQYKMIDWIKEQSSPIFQELEVSNIRRLADKDLIIQVVDISEEKKEKEKVLTFQNLIVGYHAFVGSLKQFAFDKVSKDRLDKINKVSKLKESNADSKDIVKQLSSEIPHLKTSVPQLSYIDTKNANLLSLYGFNIDGKRFKDGDVIIYTPKTQKYYETNTSESYTQLSETLKIIYGVTPGHIPGNLRGSPYGPYFRYLDHVHQYGIKAYLFITILIVVIISKSMRKKKRSNKSQSILDDPSKFD